MESSTGSDPNHYKFIGKERDSESGLDDFGARYYVSRLGSFMQPNPEQISGFNHLLDPQGWNGYSYVRNSPTVFVDPHGAIYEDCGDHTLFRGNGAICGQNQSGADPGYRQDDGNSDAKPAKKPPTNQPVDPEPRNPDGSRKPPPVPVPGCPTCGWRWVRDGQNSRGGRWVPTGFPPTPGGMPGASWDPGSGGGPGHWDVDDGNKNRTHFGPNGNPMPIDVAHPPGWKPTYNQVMVGVGALGAGYLIYRGVRMIPSLVIPPLWPTIPLNAAIP